MTGLTGAVTSPEPGPAPTTRDRAPRGGLVVLDVPVDRIVPDPDQPRTEFDPDALERLARSLSTHGQIQPISVRAGERPGRYVIVTGERRWRAAVSAGLPTISAVFLDGPQTETGSGRLELQLIENALREGLTPLDQARAFRALSERNGWSSRQVAEVLHIHGTTVSRSLALLKLPEPLAELVESGRIGPRVALEVAKVGDRGDRQALAARVVAEGLTRRETASAVDRLNATADRPLTAPPPPAPAIVNRLVFPTSSGRVIVELDTAGSHDAIVDALNEVAQALLAGARAQATFQGDTAAA